MAGWKVPGYLEVLMGKSFKKIRKSLDIWRF